MIERRPRNFLPNPLHINIVSLIVLYQYLAITLNLYNIKMIYYLMAVYGNGTDIIQFTIVNGDSNIVTINK